MGAAIAAAYGWRKLKIIGIYKPPYAVLPVSATINPTTDEAVEQGAFLRDWDQRGDKIEHGRELLVRRNGSSMDR